MVNENTKEIHALMSQMGELKLNKNEKFIEILGKLLMQFNETVEYQRK